MKKDLPPSWNKILAPEFEKPYFKKLEAFVDQERASKEIFPPEEDVFSAFQLTPYDDVRVLLLGQDPYHDNNQAHGLCFSVLPGIKTPPSLVNMYKELQADLGCKIPKHGYLVNWAKQGMLMINAVLTVQAHQPNSHKSQGWEQFIDAVIKKVNEKDEHVIFLLWGGFAQKKEKLIDTQKHSVIKSAHPSPLSAKNGFFGSKPYSKINDLLESKGQTPIDWQLPMDPKPLSKTKQTRTPLFWIILPTRGVFLYTKR
jgi:uracil-DNA glycosylase